MLLTCRMARLRQWTRGHQRCRKGAVEYCQDFQHQVVEIKQKDKALAVENLQVISGQVVECHLRSPGLAVVCHQVDRGLVVVDHQEAGLAAEDHQVEVGLAVVYHQVDQLAAEDPRVADLVEEYHLAEDHREGHRDRPQPLGLLLHLIQASSRWGRC